MKKCCENDCCDDCSHREKYNDIDETFHCMLHHERMPMQMRYDLKCKFFKKLDQPKFTNEQLDRIMEIIKENI